MRLQEIIKQVKPAVVAMSAIKKGGPKGFVFDIVGSGFNIHPNGLVVTNHHVIKCFVDNFMQRKQVPGYEIDMLQGEALNALFYALVDDPSLKRTIKLFSQVVRSSFYDEEKDFSLCTLSQIKDSLPYLRLEDSNKVEEGDEVCVCGFPYGSNLHDAVSGVHISVCTGIISSIIPFAGVPEDYIQAFQLDILLNPGNSGGPVIHAKSGRVIGIATSTYSPKQSGVAVPSGISFAIPINFVKKKIQNKCNISEDEFQDFQDKELPDGLR